MTGLPDLLVVGAGGLGRETVAAVRALNAANPTFTLRGFLDDNPTRADTEVDGLPVLGPIDRDRVDDFPDAQLVVCAGSAHNRFSRPRIVARLELPAERYATVVHPSALLPAGSRLGAGCVVLAAVVTTTAVELGEHVALMPGVVFAHDVEVDNFATFGAGVRLAGEVTVGAGAYLGAGALVREGCHVGPWSVVGMGAAVLHDVPTAEAWVGNPARRLRTLELPPPAEQ